MLSAVHFFTELAVRVSHSIDIGFAFLRIPKLFRYVVRSLGGLGGLGLSLLHQVRRLGLGRRVGRFLRRR